MGERKCLPRIAWGARGRAQSLCPGEVSFFGLCSKQFTERCRSRGSKPAKHPQPLQHKRWRQIRCDNNQGFRCFPKGFPTPLLSLRRLAMHSSVLLKSVTPLPSPRRGLLCENLYLPLACYFLHCSEGHWTSN